MNILSNFGETLADLIFDAKLSPEKLSAQLGIDVSVIYKYLRKEVLPSLKNALAIADCFHCSLDFLFGLAPETASLEMPPAATDAPLNAIPFAARFKQVLSDRGYTRYRFCKEFHLSAQRVDDWFHGKRLPTIESLLRLATLLDCSLDYLAGRE